MYINRIIETIEVNPREIVPNEKNWRRHPKHQKEAMNETLNEIGWIQDVIVNKRTGHLIDGHLRLELAIKNNEESIPVKYVDLTEEEETKALITFDPLSSMAEIDRGLLDDLISSLQESEPPLPDPEEADIDTLQERSSFKDVVKDSKIAIGAEKYDPVEEEWRGMPEYNSTDQSGIHKITVHFESVADMMEFSKCIDQPLTAKSNSIWFPKRTHHDHLMEGYVTDED